MRMDRKSLHNAVDLALRRTDGRTFQAFFGRVMTAKHGEHFNPTTTDYSQGDLKCDGLLFDPLTICACYGPVNAGHDQGEKTTKETSEKIITDFKGALAKWPDMKVWKFAHSFTATPSQFLQKINQLKTEHPTIDIKLYGRDRFIADIAHLDDETINDLVGDAALQDAFKNLQPAEVLLVVNRIMEQSVEGTTFDEEPRAVPARKIEFNEIDGRHEKILLDGYANFSRVQQILLGHPNADLQRRLASTFKNKYDELDFQGFNPKTIMDKLVLFAMADEEFTFDRQAAAVSVVAYLFQLCTIFKEPPKVEVAA